MDKTEISTGTQSMNDNSSVKIENNVKTKKKNKYVYLFFKRVFDIVTSGLGIFALSFVFALIALAIKLDDGGKVFYSHLRVGMNGKPIKIYKFRTMIENADVVSTTLTPEQLRQYEAEYKVDDDPRVTRVGKFLRKTSLDELPQLVNIFAGTLSLIGPRPLVERELDFYGDDRDKLLSVKPGLTGYWQAYARNTVTYSSGERQQMELYYVENRSAWLDVKIFFQTFIAVLRRTGI